MKFLLVLVVLVVAAWVFFGRRKPPPPAAPPRRAAPGPGAAAAPQAMLACAHCRLHLPQAEALMDVGGRPYCSEAHRLLGPR